MNTKKFLAEKTYLYLVGDRKYTAIDSDNSDDLYDEDNARSLYSGTIVRTGDMIKLGRVCLYIKEWSLDAKRHKE